jgi:hypothetical protein
MVGMDRTQPERCACCRALFGGYRWTVVTPAGFNDHICRACGPHVRLGPDGTVLYPATCPNVSPPGLRLV